MTRRSVIGAQLDGHVGEHVLDVEHERRARRAAASQPATPSGSGGDMTMTASGRIRWHRPATAAMPVNPAKASARAGMLVLSVGNGWSRVIQPHAVPSVRHETARPPRLDGRGAGTRAAP